MVGIYLEFATSRMQYPKVPNVTEESLPAEPPRWTLRREMSCTTGADMVVIRRSTAPAKRRNVPIW